MILDEAKMATCTDMRQEKKCVLPSTMLLTSNDNSKQDILFTLILQYFALSGNYVYDHRAEIYGNKFAQIFKKKVILQNP